MAVPPRHVQIGVALIRRGDAILLVRQQGPDEPEHNWALPGGIVEPGELPTEAMVREVREETGLAVLDPGRLLYVASGVNMADGGTSTAFVFAVGRWAGEVAVADPDGLVSETRFFAVDAAIERLRRLPWRNMREPIVAHLAGEVGAGAFWLYRFGVDGEATLVGRVPGDDR